jgi:hypothetical protein
VALNNAFWFKRAVQQGLTPAFAFDSYILERTFDSPCWREMLNAPQ